MKKCFTYDFHNNMNAIEQINNNYCFEFFRLEHNQSNIFVLTEKRVMWHLITPNTCFSSMFNMSSIQCINFENYSVKNDDICDIDRKYDPSWFYTNSVEKQSEFCFDGAVIIKTNNMKYDYKKMKTIRFSQNYHHELTQRSKFI